MPSAPLTRQQIVDAALAVSDEGGLEGLSMRAVATRLGVQAMSLYHHVANKAALIDALHERLLLSLSFDLGDVSWDEALRRVARALRELAEAHPRTFVLLATRPLSTPAEMRHMFPIAEALARGGFSPREQLLVVNLFFTSVGGLLLAAVGPVPGHGDVPEPTADAVRALGDHPVARLLRAADDEGDYLASHFDACVELLLAGVRTLRD